MKITTLVENTRLTDRPDLTVEKGLSIHINTMNKQILFDSGRSDIFIKNAKLLDVDIKEVDFAVISHRHHDHGNGIVHFNKQNLKAPIYFRDCKKQKYIFKSKGFKHNIGLKPDLFLNTPERFHFIDKNTEIDPNVFIITEISNKYPTPKGNKYLFTQSDVEGKEQCKPDLFEHELIMIVKEDDGLVVISGCAHSGILNIVDTAIKLFPNYRIKALVGGFHLVGFPLLNSIGGTKQEIEYIAEKLHKFPIDKLYTGHCTGIKAYQILKNILKDKISYLPTGTVIDI